MANPSKRIISINCYKQFVEARPPRSGHWRWSIIIPSVSVFYDFESIETLGFLSSGIRVVLFWGVFLQRNKPSFESGLPVQKSCKGWVDLRCAGICDFCRRV
jgi:hypothetical protein